MHLEKISEQYRVITSNVRIFEFLKSIRKNVIKLNDIIPEEGPKWEEVIKLTKEIHNEFRNELKNVKFNDMVIFEGYEYQIFMQLAFIIRIRKVLEDKISTILILDTRFSSIFFSILKFAENLGYTTNMKIGLIKGDQIEYHDEEFDKKSAAYRREFFISKQKKILKHSFGSGLSLNKFKAYYRLATKIFVFLTHSTSYKIQSSLNVDIIKKTLKKVDKKIIEDHPYEANCCFFVSAIREDLYIRPLYPIMNKLKEHKKHFHIVTADLSTALVLSRTNRPFINIFDEFNIIYENIKNTEIGINVSEQIKKITSTKSSVFALKEFTSELIDKSFRVIAIMMICENIISKMHLQSSVVAPTGEIFENTVIEIVKKYSIPSFSIPPGTIESNPFYSKWFKSNKICVYGNEAMEILKKLGYNENRILVTGNPKYDYIKDFDSVESKIKLEKTLKINSKKKLVVIGMSRWHDNDEIWMSELIRFCNRSNFEIIIKTHPLYKIESQYNKKKIEIISQKCKGLRFSIIQDIDLPTLLSASDIVITDYSTIGIEAVLHEKPLISVNFLKENWEEEYPSRMDKYGASLHTEDYKMLERMLIEILIQEKHLEKLREGRKKVIMNYNFGNDGKAADRIYHFITLPIISS